jgi:hypothetical protein
MAPTSYRPEGVWCLAMTTNCRFTMWEPSRRCSTEGVFPETYTTYACLQTFDNLAGWLKMFGI